MSGLRGRSWEGEAQPWEPAAHRPDQTPLTLKYCFTFWKPRPHWTSASLVTGSKASICGGPSHDSAVTPRGWAGGPEEGHVDVVGGWAVLAEGLSCSPAASLRKEHSCGRAQTEGSPAHSSVNGHHLLSHGRQGRPGLTLPSTAGGLSVPPAGPGGDQCPPLALLATPLLTATRAPGERTKWQDAHGRQLHSQLQPQAHTAVVSSHTRLRWRGGVPPVRPPRSRLPFLHHQVFSSEVRRGTG